MSEEPFQNHIKSVFDIYKRRGRWDPFISLPVYGPEGKLIAYLSPITKGYRDTSPDLPNLLSRWRIENPTISTAIFQVTVERTEKWLDHLIIGRDDRLLFMLEDLHRNPIGHLGYSNFTFSEKTGEVDSILRGVKGEYSGIMRCAMTTLLWWGYQILKLEKIQLSVFLDNAHAIRFYETLGFKRLKLCPLMLVEKPGEVKWELAPKNYSGPIEKEYLYMQFDPDDCPDDIRSSLNDSDVAFKGVKNGKISK